MIDQQEIKLTKNYLVCKFDPCYNSACNVYSEYNIEEIMKQIQSIKQMTWIPKKYYVMKEKKLENCFQFKKV